jgi:hypothetical protein
MRACPRQTLHPPSGGNAAPRLFDRITVADAPKRDQGLSTDVTKLANRHDHGGRTGNSPGTQQTERPDPTIGGPGDHGAPQLLSVMSDARASRGVAGFVERP